jgi:hypothetical protein
MLDYSAFKFVMVHLQVDDYPLISDGLEASKFCHKEVRNWLVCYLQLPEDTPHYCISAVIGGGAQPYLVLGDPFMRAFYSVFSVNSSGQNPRIGLALSV